MHTELSAGSTGLLHLVVDFEVHYQVFELISFSGLQQILQLH